MLKPTSTLTMGILATLIGCAQGKTNSSTFDSLTTQPITKPVENIVATKEQKERRSKSESYCQAHNVPIYLNPNALFVDPEEKVTVRTVDEVVDRALALCYIGLKSEGL